MTREITINGKTIAIERGLTPPPINNLPGNGRPKSDLRMLCEAMRPGESVLLPVPEQKKKSLAQMFWRITKQGGPRFAWRSEGEQVRIYCLPNVEKSKHNGARPQASPVRDYA